MRIGVPTEIKSNEFRVGLVPGSVRELTARGHEVVVQSGAGAGIFADDAAYEKAGARILPTAEAVFAEADMIVKVKEPQAVEYRRLKPHQILFTYLHLAPDPEQARGLMASGATAIAYETVTDAERRSAAACADERGCRPSGDRGRGHRAPAPDRRPRRAHGRRPRRSPGEGRGAWRRCRRHPCGTHGRRPRRRSVDHRPVAAAACGSSTSCSRAACARSPRPWRSIETEVLGADVVIGAVLVAGASAPKLVTRDMLPRMKRGAVLVDVSIDQGGCFETSRPTTHADPTFEVDGIIHYCVANMPGAVPVTSAQALNNATLPFVIKLASKGVAAFDDDPHLAAGLNVRDGRITHAAVAASLGFDGGSTGKVRLVAAE